MTKQKLIPEPEMVSIPAGTPFFMGKYPITQAEYQAVMGENPSHFSGNPRNPVENISWYDAIEFCARLSELTGREYRLPSEAEWEYACRAGSTTQFSFGDDKSQLGHYAWFDANSGSRSHPVGQKKPNAFGLYDMHGNVLEWCEDTEHEDYRVLRGGSWYSIPENCRSADCDWNTPDYANCNVGLRVVCG